jgi:hypothetical protein
MGNSGGSFANSFANTLLQGMQAQQQIAAQQADLKTKRDLADAALKYHQAQTADIERKARVAVALHARMLPQNVQTATDESGSYTNMQQEAPPLSENERLAYAAAAGDFSGVLSATKPVAFKPGEGIGFTQPGAAVEPQPAPIPAWIKNLVPGGGAPAMGEPSPVAGGGGLGSAQPEAVPTPAGGAQMRFVPTIKYDGKTGNYSVDLAGKETQFQLSHQTMKGPNGDQIIESVFDPISGRVVNRYPIGVPVSHDLQQKIESAVAGMVPPGMDRTSPVFQRAVAAVSAATLLSPALQDQRLAGIEQELRSLPAPTSLGVVTEGKVKAKAAGEGGVTPGAGSLSEAITKAKALEVQTTGEKEAATIQAKNANEPPNAAAQNKITMLNSVDRQIGLVEKNFNPAFVGKGFSKLDDALAAQFAKQEAATPFGSNKYQSGALRGQLREFFGQGTGAEYEFRAALLDASDLLLRARSGAQINEQEYTRLKGTLPNLTDEPDVFVTKMKRFRAEAKAQIKDSLKLGSTSSRDLLKELDQPANESGLPPGMRYK